MRKLIGLLLILTVMSCRKDKDIKPDISGSWELRKITGTIAGNRDYPPGNGNILEFKSNNTFKVFANGASAESGTYTIQKSDTPDQWKLTFDYSGNTNTVTMLIKMNANELILSDQESCCDIGTGFYEKIGP